MCSTYLSADYAVTYFTELCHLIIYYLHWLLVKFSIYMKMLYPDANHICFNGKYRWKTYIIMLFIMISWENLCMSFSSLNSPPAVRCHFQNLVKCKTTRGIRAENSRNDMPAMDSFAECSYSIIYTILC
jgi:hypothetical protein